MKIKNMINFIMIISMILSVYNNVFSQNEKLLDEDVVDEKDRLDKGPNLKKFTHVYISLAPMFNINNSVGSEIVPEYSIYSQFGLRKKRKLCDYYSLGYDISYSRLSYRIDQSTTKLIPDTSHFDKEKLLLNNIGLELYNRFNLSKKRGNQLGYYVDLGIYGNWLYFAKHVGKNTGFDSQSKSSVQKTVNSQLNYFSEFNYGLRARMGFRKYILFGEYRLSNLFNDKYPTMPQLPGIIIGFQLGLY